MTTPTLYITHTAHSPSSAISTAMTNRHEFVALLFEKTVQKKTDNTQIL